MYREFSEPAWLGRIGPRKKCSGFLTAFGVALLTFGVSNAHGEPLDDMIEALGIREYLLASEEQCRSVARDQAQNQISASVQASQEGRSLSAEDLARLDALIHTYAREACRLGIDEGLMQGYRKAYRAALTDSEIEAALAFLSSPEGRKFAEAGLNANRAVLPSIARRQESQASRAAVLLQTRLTAFLNELSQRN